LGGVRFKRIFSSSPGFLKKDELDMATTIPEVTAQGEENRRKEARRFGRPGRSEKGRRGTKEIKGVYLTEDQDSLRPLRKRAGRKKRGRILD